MAFKPERPKDFLSLCHLNPDTIKFAMLLRDGPPNDDEDWMKGLSEEERAILEAERKEKLRSARQKPCKIKACVECEKDVATATIERVHLLKTIALAEEQLKANMDDIHTLTESNQTVEHECDMLTTTLAKLRDRERKELKEKMIEGNRTKNQLEKDINKLSEEIRQNQADEDAEREEAAMKADKVKQKEMSLSLPNVNFTISSVCKDGKKHSGVYRTTITGQKMWSCCMSIEDDASGCQDDQSVGAKSALVVPYRASYTPYSTRQAEHEKNKQDRLDSLHNPMTGIPPMGNKGYRDVRPSKMNASQTSWAGTGFDVGFSKSRLEPGTIQASQSISMNSKGDIDGIIDLGPANSTGSQQMAFDNDGVQQGSLMSPINLGKMSLSFLESNITRIKEHKASRPSTTNGRMGSMRLEQQKVTSGPFPELRSVDRADRYFVPEVYPPIHRSDQSIDRLPKNKRIMDSASLLASYKDSMGGKTSVGKKRHLGMKNMKRLGGRPMTSQSGPHLRPASTRGGSNSLDHYCARIV